MTNPVFSGIDKMPFAGKYLTQDIVMNYVVSNEENERKRRLIAVSVLGFFVVAHSYQSYLGINGIIQNENFADQTGHDVNLGLSTIEVSYAGINAAVTLRELELLKRIESIWKKKRQKFLNLANEPNEKQKVKSEKRSSIGNYRFRNLGTAALITLAAQGIGYGSTLVSQNDNEKAQCIEQVSDQLQSTENDQYSHNDKVQSIEFACDVDDLATRIP